MLVLTDRILAFAVIFGKFLSGQGFGGYTTVSLKACLTSWWQARLPPNYAVARSVYLI